MGLPGGSQGPWGPQLWLWIVSGSLLGEVLKLDLTLNSELGGFSLAQLTIWRSVRGLEAWSHVRLVPFRAETKGRDRAYRHASHRLIILVQAYT